jgi:flagellar motor protein MotB
MTASLLLGALVSSGCSAGKPPLGTLSQAELAVQQADKSAASVYAPRELQIASDQRIAAVGYSKAYPVASNNTEAGRQQNRREEVVMQ